MRHQRLALALEQPLADAIGVAVLAEFAPGIEQHDDHRPFADHGLHHLAVTGFADVASLAEVDVPGRGTHQAVGVDKFDDAAARYRRIKEFTTTGQFYVTDRRRHQGEVASGGHAVAVE